MPARTFLTALLILAAIPAPGALAQDDLCVTLQHVVEDFGAASVVGISVHVEMDLYSAVIHPVETGGTITPAPEYRGDLVPKIAALEERNARLQELADHWRHEFEVLRAEHQAAQAALATCAVVQAHSPNYETELAACQAGQAQLQAGLAACEAAHYAATATVQAWEASCRQ